MKRAALLLAAVISLPAAGQGFSILAGATKFGQPSDGVYWNINQENDRKLEDKALGLRWDSERLRWNTSIAVQYTHFGKATVNALAVTRDAPDPGGYLADTGGQCVGTCAPLAQWIMKSKAQSLAFIGSKHFWGLSIEAGLNVYEAKTSGRVIFENGRIWHYTSQRYLGLDQMLGLSYKFGNNVTLRYQAWFMDGPFNTSKPEEAVAIFNSKTTQTLTLGYTF